MSEICVIYENLEYLTFGKSIERALLKTLRETLEKKIKIYFAGAERAVYSTDFLKKNLICCVLLLKLLNEFCK